MCDVEGYPNIYKWVQPDDTLIFALHIEDNMLSDANVSNIDFIIVIWNLRNVYENRGCSFTYHSNCHG